MLQEILTAEVASSSIGRRLADTAEMNLDKLGAQRMTGDGAGINTTAATVAPADTKAAKAGIHFEEHGMIKASVEEKVGLRTRNEAECPKAQVAPAARTPDWALKGVRAEWCARLQVYEQHVRKLPATALGKSADLATAGVKHGTEELLEV